MCLRVDQFNNILYEQLLLLPSAPGSAPKDVYARAASATTVIVYWKEPEIPNGEIKVHVSTLQSNKLLGYI